MIKMFQNILKYVNTYEIEVDGIMTFTNHFGASRQASSGLLS
ncbi:MAG: hypothetical protein ACI9LE_000929 [Paraglaciecola sp.]|jgi:hypothetical protein